MDGKECGTGRLWDRKDAGSMNYSTDIRICGLQVCRHQDRHWEQCAKGMSRDASYGGLAHGETMENGSRMVHVWMDLWIRSIGTVPVTDLRFTDHGSTEY